MLDQNNKKNLNQAPFAQLAKIRDIRQQTE